MPLSSNSWKTTKHDGLLGLFHGRWFLCIFTLFTNHGETGACFTVRNPIVDFLSRVISLSFYRSSSFDTFSINPICYSRLMPSYIKWLTIHLAISYILMFIELSLTFSQSQAFLFSLFRKLNVISYDFLPVISVFQAKKKDSIREKYFKEISEKMNYLWFDRSGASEGKRLIWCAGVFILHSFELIFIEQ